MDEKITVCHHGRYTSYCGNCKLDGKWCIKLDPKSQRVVCHHEAFLKSCPNCSIDGENCLIIPFDSRVVCIHGNMEKACTNCHVDGSHCVVLKNGFGVVCWHRNFTGYCGSCVVDDEHCKILSFVGTITYIDYHLDKATIKDRKPISLEQQNINNPTSATATGSVQISKSLTKTWTIQTTHGHSVTLTVETTVKVPEYSESSFSVSTTTSFSKTTTKATSETIQVSRTATVQVPPETAILATATIIEAKAEVPFTATIEYPDGKIVSEDLQVALVGYGELQINVEKVPLKVQGEEKVPPKVKGN